MSWENYPRLSGKKGSRRVTVREAERERRYEDRNTETEERESESESKRERGRCYVAGLEDGTLVHEPNECR